MSVFVHAHCIKTLHAGWGVKKWQHPVHVVVECPLKSIHLTKKTHFLSLAVLVVVFKGLQAIAQQLQQHHL